MKYYFYNELGQVTTIYYVEPPTDFLENAHIISDIGFEEKEGHSKILTVDLVSLELKCEYIKNPPSLEDEVLMLKEEVAKMGLMLKSILNE